MSESANSEAFKVLERLFSQRSRFERFAMLYLHNAELAQDIMMDSFKYFCEHYHDIDLGGNVEAYMFKVVRNKCLDWLRSEQRRRDAEETMLTDAAFELKMRITTLEAFDPNWLYDADLQARVRRSLASLPEKTRQIFLMSRRDDMTYQEIATATGLSVKSVEFHISKALRVLRADLGDTLCMFLCLLVEMAA